MRLFVGLALALAACDAERPPASVPAEREETGSEVVKRLVELIKKDGSIVFRSWGGRWIGTDVDTDVKLTREGKAIKVHYGLGPEKVEGTYAIDMRGTLTLSLPNGETWPSMTVIRDSRAFVLRAIGTPAKPFNDPVYWTFRELPASSRTRFTD